MLPGMNELYQERPSDSPFVQSFAWGRAEQAGVSVLYPDCTWYLLLTRHAGRTRLVVGGPVSQVWQLPHAAGTEWLGIRLPLGSFLPHLPPRHFVNTAIRGSFKKSSGCFPIRMMSACLVIAQKGSMFGRSYQKTGSWFRTQVHSGCG